MVFNFITAFSTHCGISIRISCHSSSLEEDDNYFGKNRILDVEFRYCDKFGLDAEGTMR